MLIADWPAGKGEAVGDVLAQLAGTIRRPGRDEASDG
jgi:hypothetical protein